MLHRLEADRKSWAGCFALLMICSLSTLYADFQDHLKPALNKGGHHGIRNVDFIYLINLDERPEKLARSMSQLAPYGIHPYRFSAVNGWKLTLDSINDLGVVYEPWMRSDLNATYYYFDDQLQRSDDELCNVPGRTYYCRDTALGTIGIMLSHLSILQDAWDSGYETIWVMEDDIQVLRDPRSVSDLIEELDEVVHGDWDMLFTDRDGKDGQGNYVPCVSYSPRPNFTPIHPERFQMRRKVGSHFEQVGARYCTTSFIIRRSGMRKLLDFHKQYRLFLPIDMEMTQPEDIRIICVTEDIISNLPGAETDNCAPYYMPLDELANIPLGLK